MKRFVLILFLIGFGYAFYWYFLVEKNVQIQDSLIVKKNTSFDFSEYNYFETPQYGYIEGEIENKTDDFLVNVRLAYKIGNDTVITFLGVINPNQTLEFKTDGRTVRGNNPNYRLLKITYDNKGFFNLF